MSSISLTDPNVKQIFNAAPYQPKQTKKTGFRQRTAMAFVSPILSGIRTVGQTLLRPLIYYASSNSFKSKMDSNRLEESRAGLRKFGGETVLLRTEDGVILEAMYFDVSKFRDMIANNGGQFVLDRGVLKLRSYSAKLTQDLKNILILENGIGHFSYTQLKTYTDFELSRTHSGNPSITQDSQVTILTQGNACLFEFDRKGVSSVLCKGQNCLVFNIRGTGRSTGTPDEQGTYKDIEAAYQFLRAKGFPDQQISVIGYCLGSGLATELATRHRVHLSLDRPFAKIGDPMAQIANRFVFEFLKLDPKTSRIARIMQTMEPFTANVINYTIISYDNHSKLASVLDKRIGYFHSGIDQVVPLHSRIKMKNAIEKSPGAKVHVSADFEHCGGWDPVTQSVFLSHAHGLHTIRDFPETDVPNEVVQRKDTVSLLGLIAFSVVGATVNPSAGLVGSAVAVKLADELDDRQLSNSF